MHREELLRTPLAFMAPAQVLDGLSADDAAKRIPGVTHSIVEILAHIAFWQGWFLQRCAGIAAPMAAHAADGWPPATAADWERLRTQFLSDLERAVHLPGDGPVTPSIEFPPVANYTVADVIVHIGQHNAHHLGQIVTLRQALGLWPPPQGSYTW